MWWFWKLFICFRCILWVILLDDWLLVVDDRVGECWMLIVCLEKVWGLLFGLGNCGGVCLIGEGVV